MTKQKIIIRYRKSVVSKLAQLTIAKWNKLRKELISLNGVDATVLISSDRNYYRFRIIRQKNGNEVIIRSHILCEFVVGDFVVVAGCYEKENEFEVVISDVHAQN